jgi:hypothetical protein
MKQPFFILCLVILFFSCSEPNKELVITFESSSGLGVGDCVILKKQTIGEVTKIEFNDNYTIDVHIYLDKIKRLPKDSKFLIAKDGIFDHGMYVVPGKSKSYLTTADRPRGKTINDPNINELINEFFDKVVVEPIQTQDSVLNELRDIKQEIHEVNKKTH